jgi:hypothetical protein
MRFGPRREPPWWALPPLALTTRYYGPVIPAAVLAELASGCRWVLRAATGRQRLSDVSHTQLWIEAFPGLEWSRSLVELAAYMYARIRPDEATLQVRSHTQLRQDWGVQSAWSKLSQHQRMLRWLTHRPTRPAAMHTVRSALESS